MRELIGSLFAMALVLGVLAAYLPKWHQASRQRIDNAAAAQFASFTDAAQTHLNANYTDLLTQLSSTPMVILFPGDIALPGGFSDNNTYTQQHAFLLRDAGGGELRALALTYGGEDMPLLENIRLAQLAGPLAGLVRADDSANVVGASGHWSVPIANWSAAPPAQQPVEGHLAALITTDATSALSPFLHREGHPNGDANTLFTDLAMAGHEITDLADALLSDGTGGLVHLTAIVASGAAITQPTCPASLTPAIFVAPVWASGDDNGLPMIAVQAFAETLDAATWTARLRVVTQDPAGGLPIAIEPSGDYGQLLVLTRCQ